MSIGSVKIAVGTIKIPASVLALSSLPHISYADQFALSVVSSTSLSKTPEQWARAMFGSVPSFFEILIWRVLLGLRISRGRSPQTVAGWKIGGRGEDWIRLEAAGWFLTGNLLVRRCSGWVELVTMLHYRRWLGWVVWGLLGGIHRRIVPGVLRGAVARMGAG